MMTAHKEGTEAFQTLLRELYGHAEIADSLQKLRVKAWEHFLGLGLPTRKDDVYRYVKLRSFFSANYESSAPTEVTAKVIESHILPECSQSVAVFVNGHFSPSLSRLKALPKRVAVMPLADGMGTFGSFLSSQWVKNLKDEKDPFATINAALHRDGLFLYFPPKTIFEQPIQLLNVVDTGNVPMLLMPRIQVFAGAQSELSLVSTQALVSGDKYACNMLADFSVEEDARLDYTQATHNLGDAIWYFDAVRAVVKRNSRFKTINATKGSATVRSDYRVALAGENSEVSLNGVCVLSEKNESHAHVLVDHQAPHCRSMQLFKCALLDMSHSAFEGKILVRQAAQKTEAFQLNNNLLLSDRANAESKPNLEIFADDVKASHGSTVGQLDSEQIFYMKTRGFSTKAAENLLMYGFCQEVIDMIPISSLQDSVRQALIPAQM